MSEQRDSFLMYRSFVEAINQLPIKYQLECYRALTSYALDMRKITMSKVVSTVFSLMQPNIDSNYRKYLNGKKQKKSKGQASNKQNEANESKHLTNANVDANVDVNVDVGVCNGSASALLQADDTHTHTQGNGFLSKEELGKLCGGIDIEFVKLTLEDIKKLKAEGIDDDDLDKYITNLNDHIGSTGTKYDNHRWTILKWARKDYQKENNL